MSKKLPIGDLMNSLVPISRFNRGEANKVFEEVSEYGVKIVLKNNTPACVLMKPSAYEAMVEALEDYALYFEAEQRMALSENRYLPEDQVLADLGITKDEL
jgi:antitoxin StbD